MTLHSIRIVGNPASSNTPNLTLTIMEEKFMTNLESILKSRDITLSTKVHLVKGYDFSSSHAWMWDLDYKESWAPRNWCFWTVGRKRLLRFPWTARRSNQSILKVISPEYLLEGLMLKQKLQYFGHLMRRTDLFEKILMLGKIEGGRSWEQDNWMVLLSQWTWVSVNSRSWW